MASYGRKITLLPKKLLKNRIFSFMNIFNVFNKENNISIEKSLKNYINKDFEVLQYLGLGFTKGRFFVYMYLLWAKTNMGSYGQKITFLLTAKTEHRYMYKITKLSHILYSM